MIDCLIIGYNDLAFTDFVDTLKAMGKDHPDYRDLNLNYIEYKQKPYRALDIFTHFYYENKPDREVVPFHNSEVLWMAIMYLGTYIHKRGFSFDYINLFQFEKDKLKEKLLTNRYRSIAITTTIYNFDQPVMEVLSFIKQYNTESSIIVGGPFISKRFERLERDELQLFLKYMEADFYIYSREGEAALAGILKALKEKSDFSQIPNIAYRNGSKGYHITPDTLELNPLDDNLIDYSLFPAVDLGKFVNIRISKGCPYNCAFCGFPQRTKKYMCKSVEAIREEMRGIKAAGDVESFFFIDDTVNVPKKRFKEILRMMIQEKFNFKWNCFFRCDHMDEETADLMKESGCEGVFLGLESANEVVLKNMNKSAGLEHYRKTIPMFKERDMIVFLSTFIGFPGETFETVNETTEFMREMEPDFYRAQLWYCDPVTPIWQRREDFGLEGTSFSWKHNTMDADKACDLMEDAFLRLDKPIWAPDPGFNFISHYILRQRGVSFEKQREFLRAFNACVKEKLLFPDKKEISDDLIAELRRTCLFDEETAGAGPGIVLRNYADTSYLNAEKYWLNERKVISLPSFFNGEMDGPEPSVKRGQITGKVPSLSGDTGQVVGKLLAAFTVLLNKIHSKEIFPLHLRLADTHPFPFFLSVSPDSRWKELLERQQERLEAVLPLNTCLAGYINTPFLRRRLTGGFEREEGYPALPSFHFRYGFFVDTGGEGGDAVPSDWTENPRLEAGLALAIYLRNNDEIRIRFSANHFGSGEIREYLRALEEICAQTEAESQLKVDDIQVRLPAPGAESPDAVSSIVEKDFSF